MTKLGIGEKLLFLVLFIFLLFRFVEWYWAAVVIVGILTIINTYLQYQQGYFERLGIPSPPAGSLFMGHLTNFRKEAISSLDVKWMREYGKFYGNFLGSGRELVTFDLDLLRLVFVKDFGNFMDRRSVGGTDKNKKSLMSNIMTRLQGQHWKDVRNTVTPAFTAGKMKHMVPLINDSIKVFEEILTEKADAKEGIDIKKVTANLTLDVIGACAFGLEVNAQRNPDIPFVKHTAAIFKIGITSWRVIALLFFTKTVEVLEKVFNWNIILQDSEEYFMNTVGALMEDRKKGINVRKDFLQLLLAAIEDDEKSKDDTTPNYDDAISHKMEAKKIKLTKMEIVAQSFLFLIAGYETTANTLQFLYYSLAVHPEIQEQVLNEIQRVVPDEEEATIDHINKMPYLESVMFETLRMYPAAVRVNRVCKEDYEFKGIKIEKGTSVSAPVYGIHHSEQFYPEPEKFDPDRFSPENKGSRDPLTFLTFGYGPRNCIGMRFAQMEIKLAVANILRKFEFYPIKKTEKMPVKISKEGLLKPEKPLIIGVRQRQK